MKSHEVDVGAYRLFVRLLLFLSIGLVAFALYQLVPAPPEFRGVPRIFENQPGPRSGVGVMALGLGILALAYAQRFKIRPTPGAENLILFLTKPDCTLCEEARPVLRSLVDGTPFMIEELNILDHRHLRRRFKNHIPVVLWQGDELARMRVDAVELKAKLDAILAARAPPAP